MVIGGEVRAGSSSAEPDRYCRPNAMARLDERRIFLVLTRRRGGGGLVLEVADYRSGDRGGTEKILRRPSLYPRRGPCCRGGWGWGCSDSLTGLVAKFPAGAIRGRNRPGGGASLRSNVASTDNRHAEGEGFAGGIITATGLKLSSARDQRVGPARCENSRVHVSCASTGDPSLGKLGTRS